MDSKVTLAECRDILMHHHYSTWKFKKSCLTSPSVKTTVFSPIPNSDVSFYFELWYKEFCANSKSTYFFKINFVKSCGINIPLFMKMDMKITIIYSSNDQVFREYKQDDINVGNMSTITIANEIFDRYIYATNGAILDNPNVFDFDFALKCHLVFHDHLSTPAAYYKDMRSLNTLYQFADDFSCLYQDQDNQASFPESGNQLKSENVEIKIGDEIFFAHKSVLAAHSPVFLKMLNHDFLESKTKVININDFSAETFRSFLEYLYSGKISDKSWTLVKELYALANKYDVRTLKRECGEISSTYLSVEAACEILQMAYDYGDDYLKLEAKKFAFNHVKELLPRRDWKEMVQHNPLIGYEVMIKYASNSQFGLIQM